MAIPDSIQLGIIATRKAPHYMNASRPRTIIFDFNGVIADDESTHFQAFQQVLSEYGLSITNDEYYEQYLGMDERTCVTALIRSTLGKEDPALVDQIAIRKSAVFRTLTAMHPPRLFPSAIEFVKDMSHRCLLAIASGGRREQIELVLRGTPIEKAFVVQVSAEDAPIGKPDPAIYVIALENLNRVISHSEPLGPYDCLVIEDSLAGIRAGHSAGMKVVALATTYPASRLGDADMVVESLQNLGWADLQKLYR